MNKENAKIVEFHIGRGGRNNNQGHLTFCGVGTTVKNTIESKYFTEETEDGSTILIDDSGNEIGEVVEDGKPYHYDIDGDFNTSYGKLVSSFNELTDEEQKAIIKSGIAYEFELAFDCKLTEEIED
jgi:hypothetical protein